MPSDAHTHAAAQRCAIGTLAASNVCICWHPTAWRHALCPTCVLRAQVLHCEGLGFLADIIGGIEYVIEQAAVTGRPSVLSMSIGAGRSQVLNDAVDRLQPANVVAVVAAGNSNDDACSYSPASAPSALTVGSTSADDRRSAFR